MKFNLLRENDMIFYYRKKLADFMETLRNLNFILKKSKNEINLKNDCKLIQKNFKKQLVALVIASFVLIPYLVLVSSSFMDNNAFIVKDYNNLYSFNNYLSVFNSSLLKRCFLNSLIISGTTTMLSLLISIPASYALTRLNFKWKTPLVFTLYGSQMVPGISYVVSFLLFFIMIKKTFFIPMQGTYHGMILTYTALVLPFSILMMKNFFSNIPKDLDEQAQIDGCDRIQIISKIIIPLAFPGIVSVSIYSFLISWNELLFAFSFTNSNTATISIGLVSKAFYFHAEWAAAGIIVTIPFIIIFSLLKKQLKAGLGINVLKG